MTTFTAVFRAFGDYSNAIKEGQKLAKSFDDSRLAANRAGKAGASFGTRVGVGLNRIQGQSIKTGQSLSLGLTAPIALLGIQAGRTFADFEKRIVAAGSKTDATKQQLADMKKVALDTAAATKFSATEAAEGLDILAAAGFSARDAIGTLPAVTKAAQAQNADLGLTAEVTAKAMNAFSIPVEKAAHVADVFTQASNTTTLDMQQLKDALGQVGEVGPRFNQSLEDVVAVTGRLADLGVPAASAGTAIRQALTFLSAPTNRAANLMELLGINVRTASGDMKALPDLIQEVQTKLSTANPKFKELGGIANLSGTELKNYAKANHLTVAQVGRLQQAVAGGDKALRDYTNRTIFGVEGAKAFALAASNGKPVLIDVRKEQEKLTKVTNGLARTMGVDAARAFVAAHTSGDQFAATGVDAVRVVSALNKESDGVADKVAGLFQATTAQKAENFRGALEALAITAFDKTSPALNQILDDLTHFVGEITNLSSEYPTLVRFAGGFLAIAAAIGPTLFIGGKFLGFVRSVKGVVGAAQGALQTGAIYLQLYGEQASLAGNKVRGGLLSNLGKVTSFLGGPWGVAIGLGVTVLGGLISAHNDAKQASKAFADSLDYENGKLAENSRSVLSSQLAHEGVLENVVKAGVSERDFTDALIQGGAAREAMITQLKGIQAAGTKFVQYGYTTGTQISDQGQAAKDAAADLEKYGVSLDESGKQSVQAANASGQAAAANTEVGSTAGGAAAPIRDLTGAQKDLDSAEQQLASATQDVIDKFSILRGDALSTQEASDRFKSSIISAADELKGGKNALDSNTKAGLANRAVVRGLIQDLNAKVTADFKSNVSSKGLGEATRIAAEELKKGRKQIRGTATDAGLAKGDVSRFQDQLLLTPDELKTEVETPGVEDSKSKIHALKEEIKGLKSREISVTTTFKNNAKSVAQVLHSTAQNLGYDIGPTKRAEGGQIDKVRRPQHLAGGGRVQNLSGKGLRSYDTEPAMLRVDEHVWTPEEVAGAGGHGKVKQLRAAAKAGALSFKNGGAVNRKVTVRGSANGIDADSLRAVVPLGEQLGDVMGKAFGKAVESAGQKMFSSVAKEINGSGGGPVGGGGYKKALSFAKSQVGKPYIFGAAGPRGYDCSGFMAAIQNVIEGKAIYHRRYSTPAFYGAKANGFTRGKKSPFMVGVNPAPGKSGHMAGTLNGTNVESAGGVGVRVGGRARGYNASMFSWRGGLAVGGPVVPGRGGNLPFDLVDPQGERYNPTLAKLAERLYGARAHARGSTGTGHLSLTGERGAELLRTRTGSQVMTTEKTLDYLSRLERAAVNAPTALADLNRAAPGMQKTMPRSSADAGPVTLNMPMSFVPERSKPTMVAQRQIVRAGRTLNRRARDDG